MFEVRIQFVRKFCLKLIGQVAETKSRDMAEHRKEADDRFGNRAIGETAVGNTKAQNEGGIKQHDQQRVEESSILRRLRGTTLRVSIKGDYYIIILLYYCASVLLC